ncbi:MAG: hypothetical protein ACLFU2_14810 [Opitutales bacterium]
MKAVLDLNYDKLWFWPLVMGDLWLLLFPMEHALGQFGPLVCFVLSGCCVGLNVLQGANRKADNWLGFRVDDVALVLLVALVVTTVSYVFGAWIF